MRTFVRLLAAIVPIVGTVAHAGNVDLPRFPAVSPDGAEVVFTWRGDLWKAPTDGGHALRLTSNEATERRAAWSPDGERIAFESDRTGARNLFVMNADGSDVRPVTDTDVDFDLSGFSADGSSLLFDASREGDVYRASRPYRVALDGGPIDRLLDCFGESPVEFGSDQRVLFTRGGSSWSRRHYRGPDARDVWLYDRSNDAFRRLTEWVGNDGMARPLGRDGLIFASDRTGGVVNLYALKLRGEGVDIRHLTRFEQDVQSFAVSDNGETIVACVWDALYRVDPRTGEATRLAFTASEDERDNFERIDIDDEVDVAALSPDGQVMAVIAYGDVYVRNIDDDSPTRRVTSTPGRELGLAWAPDNERLYFSGNDDAGTVSIFAATVDRTRSDIKEAIEPADEPEQATEEANADVETSDESPDETEADAEDPDEGDEESNEKEADDKPAPGARWHDALTFTIEPIVQTEFDDQDPTPSPDGQRLAFRRTLGDVMILDLETGDVSRLIEGWDRWMSFSWSPDGRHIAYHQYDRNYNADVFIIATDGAGDPVNISMHPDNDYDPVWSGDGRTLGFLSERINEETDVWAVHLDPELDATPDRDLKTYYEDRVKRVKKRKPLEPQDDSDGSKDEEEEESASEDEGPTLSLDDAYLRLRRLTSHRGDENDLHVTHAGDRFVYTASDGVYTVKWDGSDEKKIGARASIQHIGLKDQKVVTVRSGRARIGSISGGDEDTITVAWPLRVDLQAQNRAKFEEAARLVGRIFYHPDMKGLDWDSLARRYRELATQTRTAEEFRHVASRLLGELNASHLGVYPPDEPRPNARRQGRLGIDLEPVWTSPSAEHPFDIAYRVSHVVDQGPGDAGVMSLREGDLITGIEFEALRDIDTIDSRLTDRIGRETVVSVLRRDPDTAEWGVFDLLLTPTSYGAEVRLRYDDWQRRRRAFVHQWSDGRIGYLHIRSMGGADLVEFERDLFAAANGKDGLLIDVRNNGGGSTADRVLASIMVRPHAYCIPRGGTLEGDAGYPQDRLYIQRYTQPVNMLCNEKSFSNAEIVSHAFKTLDRGTLVGQQTYGGVISTGGARLIDGTWVRLPFRGWFLPDGTDMENNGAIPDIIVPQTPEDEASGYDRQLHRATLDLLERLD